MNKIERKMCVDEAKRLLGCETDRELAAKLGINPSRVSHYRARVAPGFPRGYLDADKIVGGGK